MVNQSVSSAVREILNTDLPVQDSLQRRYGNVSAIARLLKPRVEENLKRRVKLASIVTALKRAKVGYSQPPPSIQEVLAESHVSVRTDVAKLSVDKSKKALETIRGMLASYQEEFLQVSESTSAVTLIFDEKLYGKVISAFRRSDVLESEEKLAAIIVHSPLRIIKTPGCAITFYNQVSRRGINIEDTVSCHTDTIIVVKMENVGRAFSALTELISTARSRSRILKTSFRRGLPREPKGSANLDRTTE